MSLTSLSMMVGYLDEGLLWWLMRFGGNGGWLSDCGRNSAICKMLHLPWKSITPFSGSRGFWWVLKGWSDFQIVCWSVVCRRAVQYLSFTIWTAMHHWFCISLACDCRVGFDQSLWWWRSAHRTWHWSWLRWGFYHGAGFGLGVIHGTDMSRAVSMIVWMLSVAHRASAVVLSWLRSMPELIMWCSNSCHSAFSHERWGATWGGLRST
jgi:hypothetical protein